MNAQSVLGGGRVMAMIVRHRTDLIHLHPIGALCISAQRDTACEVCVREFCDMNVVLNYFIYFIAGDL